MLGPLEPGQNNPPEPSALFTARQTLIQRYADVRFRLADLVTITYVSGIAVLLLFSHDPLPGWQGSVVVHLGMAASIVGLVRAAERRGPGVHPLWVLRTLYPVGVMAHSWGELNAFMPLVFDSHWATASVVRWDLALFGVHPTVWAQGLYRPWLDELMAAFYVSYYAFLTVPAILLVRRQALAASAAASLIALNYFTNFAFYLLVPTKGPMHVQAEFPDIVPSQYGGYAVAGMLQSIQDAEAVVGAAFPSSHVSGATLCTLIALRYLPTMGKVLVPLVVGMAFATVYLGYHHALDPLGGLVWGATVFWLGQRWLSVRGELPTDAESHRGS